jgi:uncharacterized membrane protein YqjE
MASADLDPVPSRPGGLFNSVKAMAASLLAIAHTRLELFSVELEEEWMRVSSILTWSLIALFCAGIGIVFATLFLVFALWGTHPLLALSVPAVLFLLFAALAWRTVSAKVRVKPRLFSASLAELAKDRERLKSDS